jgi:ATP-dependent Lon protease
VGGIKEKVLAAKRSGADTVVLPRENAKDVAELPQYVSMRVQWACMHIRYSVCMYVHIC